MSLFYFHTLSKSISSYFLVFILTIFCLLSCKQSEKFTNYRLIEKRFVQEINAECYYLEHIESGAKVFKIANEDQNKTFCITFKTTPESDCGTAHILEHAVLMGSKNFPVKSPFDVMAKGSLKTYLNALTYMDRTMYPVASMNNKDYFNLMHVYLDAVFNPLLYEDSLIFMQEGWHYELVDTNDPITYKGVVYNEMKGAYSNPEQLEMYHVFKTLFPDNSYGFESGGKPEAIPHLSYNQLLDFHKKYYHPSNSYIFLYGNADMDKELHFIDSAYLSTYTRAKTKISIPIQAPLEQIEELVESYSVPEGSTTVDQSIISLTYVIGEGSNEEMSMALNIIADVLVNQESAPLRLAFQEAGIGSDISAWSFPSQQNIFHLKISNANPEDVDRFKDIVKNTLTEVIRKGIDKRALEGAINRDEFRLREGADVNKGITYSSNIITSWIHASDPFNGLEYERPLAEIKRSLSTDYLEQVIRNEILENPYAVLILLKPEPGLEKKTSAQISENLNTYKKKLSPQELQSLIESTEILAEKLNTEDPPEALASLPMLSIKDINPKTNWISAEAKDFSGIKVLHCNEFTNSILYSDYNFDLKVLTPDMLPYIDILRELLGKLNTRNFSYAELEKELNIHTGGISASLKSYQDITQNHKLIPILNISSKAVTGKANKLFDLTEEIILHTQYTDTARVKDVLTKYYSRIETAIKRDGFIFTRKRLYSYHSERGMFIENTSGIEQYWFLSQLLNNYNENVQDLIDRLEEISNTLFTKNNLTPGITCNTPDFVQVKNRLSTSLNIFPEYEPVVKDWNLKPIDLNEGFLTASKVQYVLQGANFNKLGYEYSGQMEVLNKILSSDYLHNEVRIKGGAYGGYGYLLKSGEIFFGSYRDPNLTATLDAYKGTSDFVMNFDTDSSEMIRSIIGSFSSLDYPMTASQKGDRAIQNYFSKNTEARDQRIRNEVLSTTPEIIRSLEPIINDMLNQKTYCIFGSQEKINENKNLFKSTQTIIK